MKTFSFLLVTFTLAYACFAPPVPIGFYRGAISSSPITFTNLLLAWWRMDTNTWIDSSVYGHTLSGESSADPQVLPTTTTGIISNAVNLPYSDFPALTNAASGSSFALNSSNWTVGLWVNGSLSANENRYFFVREGTFHAYTTANGYESDPGVPSTPSRCDPPACPDPCITYSDYDNDECGCGSVGGVWVGEDPGTPPTYVAAFGGTINDAASAVSIVNTNTLPADNAWFFLTYTLSNATHYRMSVNSGPWSTQAAAATTNTANTIYVGCHWNHDAWADAKIDNVFAYNALLTSNQVWQIYTNGTNGTHYFPYATP